jgi:hypothetical protein
MSRPPFYDYYDTGVNITQAMSVTDTSASNHFFRGYYSNQHEFEERKKVETKKEKLDRISKTKMLASWKKYDEKTPTVKQIKQMCKPVHRITNGAFRGLR